MAIRYLLYLMRDNQTDLDEKYFNTVFQDMDARLDKLERLQISWEEAVRVLQEFGLERIDNSIIPVLQAAQAALVEAQGMVAELQQQIEDVDVQGQLDTALAAQNAEVAAALAAQTAALNAVDTAQTTALTSAFTNIQAQLADIQALLYAAL